MKNKTHLVLDIETLSTAKSAAVLSIGWAIIKNCNIIQQNEVRLRLAEQIALGDVSADTLKWWLDGEKMDAMKALALLPEYSADIALTILGNSVTNTGTRWDEVMVWGNAPSFDCDILEHQYRVLGRGKPWKYWNERDIRTLRDVAKLDRVTPKIAHSAMWDAVAEAEMLCNYLRSLP